MDRDAQPAATREFRGDPQGISRAVRVQLAAGRGGLAGADSVCGWGGRGGAEVALMNPSTPAPAEPDTRLQRRRRATIVMQRAAYRRRLCESHDDRPICPYYS